MQEYTCTITILSSLQTILCELSKVLWDFFHLFLMYESIKRPGSVE